jgi:hypothetical protein
MGVGKMHTGMLWGDRREGITWKTQTTWEDNIKMEQQEMGQVGIEFNWLRVESVGGLL